MKHLGRVGITALAVLLASGCAGEARIALSPSMQAAAQPLELSGMGGGERGSFKLGSSAGTFTRSSAQIATDNRFFVRNYGGGSFEVRGPEFAGSLLATCDFEEEEHELGALTLPGLRFAYRCAFRADGGSPQGGLVLEEVPMTPGKLLTGRTRAGEAHFAGRVVGIRAIQDMEGSRIRSGTPLGYRFDVDGKEIGAVDLNGGSKTIYAPAIGPEREVVLAASLALAILWDPMG